MCHFVIVDFNKDINIIKHNFLKRFCNVGLSGTVLQVHLRMHEIYQQICATHKTIILMHNIQSIFLFHCNYRKKVCRKMVSLAVLGICNLEILQKQNAAI